MRIINGLPQLTVELSESRWQYIRALLGKCAYDEAAAIIQSMSQQIDAQLNPAPPPAPRAAVEGDFGLDGYQPKPNGTARLTLQEVAQELGYRRG